MGERIAITFPIKGWGVWSCRTVVKDGPLSGMPSPRAKPAVISVGGPQSITPMQKALIPLSESCTLPKVHREDPHHQPTEQSMH